MKKSMVKKIALMAMVGSVLTYGSAWGADIKPTGGSNNVLTITGSSYQFTGGSSGTVAKNDVVYGGYVSLNADSVASGSNSVTISGTNIPNLGYVYGGYAENTITGNNNKTATASSNEVTISGGSYSSDVYGGLAKTGHKDSTATASGNTVNISGGTFSANVYAGYATKKNNAGTATGNKIAITATKDAKPTLTGATLYGSNNTPNAAVTGDNANVLDLTGVSVSLNVKAINNFNVIKFGASTGTLTLTNNTDTSMKFVTIDATAITSISGNELVLISANTIGKKAEIDTITVKTASGSITGYAKDDDTNGVYTTSYSLTSVKEDKKIKITKGQSTDGKIVAGVYYNGDKGYNADDLTSGNATSGILTINKDVTKTGKSYYGSYAVDGTEAKGGTLNVTGGKVGDIYGGYSVSGNVTGNIVNISGGEVTGNVYAGKSGSGTATVSGNTLNWSGGTIKGSEIEGNNVNITGTTAKYLGTTGTVTADSAVTLGGTLTIGTGTTASTLTVTNGISVAESTTSALVGASTTNISTLNGAVNNDGTLTVSNLNLGGNVTNTGTLTSALGNLNGTITNDGTFNTSGTLTKDISGTNGTTVLNGDLKSNAAVTIAGTLNGNDKTVDMTGDRANTTLTIGTLAGTTNLKIDVDMSNFTADKLAVTNINGATVNLSAINITKDITPTTLELPKTENDKITYVTSTNGTATYNVNGSTSGSIMLTNNYKYTFTKGTTAGTLNYKVEAANLSFKKFVEGTLPYYTSDPATLSLTDNLENKGDGSTDITMGASQSNSAITINLNGKNLTSAAASTVTINSGKTINLNGGTSSTATTDANTNFVVKGSLNTSGLLKMEGSVTGDGTLTNTGTLDITANNLKVATTNTDWTINLGAGTLERGKKITGGTINITDAVTADAGDLAGAVTIKNAKTLTLNGGDIAGNIGIENTGKKDGALTIAGAVTNTNNKMVTVNTLTINSDKSLKTNIGNLTVTNDISNAGTLILTDSNGTLNNNLTDAGTLQVGNGTNTVVVVNNDKSIANNLDIKANGTFTSALSNLTGTITNGGTFNTSGILTKNITGNGTTVLSGDLKSNTAVTIDGTLDVNGKTIDMTGDSATKTLTVGTLARTSIKLKIDAVLDTNSITIDNITAGSASGAVTLETVSFSGSTDVWASAKEVTLVKSSSGDCSGLGFTTTAFGYNDYTYEFSKKLASGSDLVLTVTQSSGLPSVIQGGNITDYKLKEDTELKTDMGVFNEKTTTRPSLTIDGDNGEGGKYKLSANDKGGVTINGANDKLTIKNTIIDDFDTFATVNNGELILNNVEFTNSKTADVNNKSEHTVIIDGVVTLDKGITGDGSIKQNAGSTLVVDGNTWRNKKLFTGVNTKDQLQIANSAELEIKNAKGWDYYSLVSGDAVTNGTLSPKDLWEVKETLEKQGFMSEYDVKDGVITVEFRNIPLAVEANTSALAGVQQGAISMVNQVADAIGENVGILTRPAQEGVYDKTVWANYINSKETVNGMSIWRGEGNNTAKYHGVTVGADFYTTKKSIAGVALTYVSGDVMANPSDTVINNKTKYYGISFYDRITNGKSALVYDLGYSQGKNDITQNSYQTVTADAITNVYTLGAKYEYAYNFKHSSLVPFASLRYLRLTSNDYRNSNGHNMSIDRQNLIVPKLGLAWTGSFEMPKSDWTFKPVAEVGYIWNLKGREADGTFTTRNSSYSVQYDTVDKSSYYTKLGLNFNKKNFTGGVSYRYAKGDAARQNSWNINLSWNF